jgi:hypothetical protein
MPRARRAKPRRPPLIVRRPPSHPGDAAPSSTNGAGRRPAAAELSLLRLAREIAALAESAPSGGFAGAVPATGALAVALQKLAAAFGPQEALPRALYRAWLGSRADKTRALALSWAREQLRLGLEEVIARASGARHRALGLSAETLAWLLLAACESLAQEQQAAALDRLRALLDLTGPPGRRA